MSSEAPLYERDPEAWKAYLAEGNAKQARKRVGRGRDPAGPGGTAAARLIQSTSQIGTDAEIDAEQLAPLRVVAHWPRPCRRA